MKTYQWKLRRQFIAIPDAHHRWDRVYQNLLRLPPVSALAAGLQTCCQDSAHTGGVR